MLGLGPTELLILVVVAVVLLLAVRTLGRADGRSGSPLSGKARTASAARALSTPVPAELQSRIRTLAAADQRIQAIKLLREATGLSLLDAKNAVDAIAAGNVLPAPERERERADLAYRARSLLGAGREDEAVRLVATETGMSAPEAATFVRALLP
jgi:ribosomal protein L7/L12